MTAFQLAQVNVGRIVAPLDGPVLADFVAELPEINALAEGAEGFVWRMVDEGGADSTSLRPDRHDDMLLINCSVWESVETLREFTYRNAHLRLLGRRREWFERMADHHQVMWWVPAGHRPTVAEAMDRIACCANGASAPRRSPSAAPTRHPRPSHSPDPDVPSALSGRVEAVISLRTGSLYRTSCARCVVLS